MRGAKSLVLAVGDAATCQGGHRRGSAIEPVRTLAVDTGVAHLTGIDTASPAEITSEPPTDRRTRLMKRVIRLVYYRSHATAIGSARAQRAPPPARFASKRHREKDTVLMPAPVSVLKLILTVPYLLVWPALILLLGGDAHWTEGWMFGSWFIGVCTTTIVWLYRKDPALLAERYRRPGSGGQSGRDKIIVYLLVVGFIGWIVLMPLDARRFRWTPRLPLAAEIAGGAFLIASWLFLFRSFTDNTFLSPLVRVQTEREHRVVSTGVYGVVRHPMYLGAILMFVGGSLLVGAATALCLGFGIGLLLAVRIVEEEKLLMVELPGYSEYRGRVRYRLVPFLW